MLSSLEYPIPITDTNMSDLQNIELCNIYHRVAKFCPLLKNIRGSFLLFVIFYGIIIMPFLDTSGDSIGCGSSVLPPFPERQFNSKSLIVLSG